MKKLMQNGTAAIGIAALSTVGFLLGLYDMTIYVMFLGLGGFSGIAGLRSAIDSSGSKTYIAAIGGAVVSGAIGAGVVDLQTGLIVLGLFGISAPATLKHGVDKAKKV